MKRYRAPTTVARCLAWALATCAAGAGAGCKPSAAPASGAGAGATAGGGGPRGAAPAGHNLVWKEDFEDGKWMPWWTHYEPPAEGYAGVKDGYFCFTVTSKGGDRWDTEFHHGHMVIQKGHNYSISFKIRSTQRTSVYAIVGNPERPYREHWGRKLEVDAAPQGVAASFTMRADDDMDGELAFGLGGDLSAETPLPYAVCVDEVHLDDPQFEPRPPAREEPVAGVLVNQVGYLPGLPKLATVRAARATPWQLVDAAGAVVAAGQTVPAGRDAASGDDVSIADFSSFEGRGAGFTLKAGAEVSRPFAVDAGLYGALKYDALGFFYHQRSGIEIKPPFAREARWARPAGHVDGAPNRGDGAVRCAPEGGCAYALDGRGGWYDADGFDKAVISTGISVWTLLNWWERAGRFGSSAAEFGDGKLNLPEAGNGVPDLLDEVRWALEFELKMQVPEGQPLAGMVHQSLRDRTTNSLGIAPHQDPKARVLYPPTTAATLNVAANAAQAARLFRPYDRAFAARCLAAAERAWAAATAHPAEYARPEGLGGYDDGDVTDEFYWAAAELYITTNKPAYKERVLRSPHYGAVPSVLPAGGGDESGFATPMNWRRVQALGSISLAVARNGLGGPAVEAIRKNVVAAADAFGAIARREGYRVPFAVGPTGYPWGSNSFVLNNLLTSALAYDFTGRASYRDDVAAGVDYLLGRNPMDQSYVTGYGSRALKHPHHRFFSSQANRHYPEPPPGLLSGGPNSGLEDQHVQSAGLKGCAPAKCFHDDVDSFSTNGVSLNWNAPLVWVAAFLDEQARRPAGPGAPGSAALEKQKVPR